MKEISGLQSGFFNPRVLLAFSLFSIGASLAVLSLYAAPWQVKPAWSIVTSPSANTPSQLLHSVTCTSTSNCWAVGYYNNNSGVRQTLIEQWNGTSWTIVSSPNTSTTQDNELEAVTCASASECWAVGYFVNGGVTETLIDEWNGSSWSIVITLPYNGVFYGATCTSASQCWAVGYSENGSSVPQTFVEQWNGTSWDIVSSPDTSSTQNNILDSITCTSASDCWAVGGFVNSSGVEQTLIEQWNGTSWAIVSSPNTSSTQYNVLESVTCPSASQCSAVGFYINSSGVFQTLIEQWNGTSWTIVSSPNTSSTQVNVLQSVACTSASECWAVGYYDNSSGTFQTLVEEWNGTSWAVVSSPNTSNTQHNQLNGVTCASASECWTVGYYVSDNRGPIRTSSSNGTAPRGESCCRPTTTRSTNSMASRAFHRRSALRWATTTTAAFSTRP